MSRGVAVEGFGFGLLLAAILIGSVGLFAFAVGLLATVTGCVALVAIGGRRVRVERSISPAEVLEGRPLRLRFEQRRRSLLPVHVEVRGEDGTWRRLEGSAETGCTIERPGPHLVGRSEVRLRDDLGFFSRELAGGEPTSVLVLPDPARGAAGGRARGAVGGRNRPEGSRPPGPAPGGDLEPDGLQQYARGTPVGRIHWPSVARGAEWQERRVIAAPRSAPLVAVDLVGAPSEEAVDWTLRTAAARIQALARGGGGCRVLLAGDPTPIRVRGLADGWPEAHRRLAELPGAPAKGSSAAARGADAGSSDPADPAAPLVVPPGAIVIRATAAPALAGTPVTLPPGVVATDRATAGHGEGGLPA